MANQKYESHGDNNLDYLLDETKNKKKSANPFTNDNIEIQQNEKLIDAKFQGYNAQLHGNNIGTELVRTDNVLGRVEYHVIFLVAKKLIGKSY